MRRGELYRYERPSAPANRGTVLVLSSDETIQPTRDWVLGLQLRVDDPDDLLAVPTGDGRYAYAGDLGRLYSAWVRERVGRIDALTLARVNTVLRVALDL
ncbi:hypothetical protein WCD74_27985 [Actinomycetospora sp. OC33-EN08]|uniref:Type II toxin-antitoxin system PemK/MazF family toxin n=1 Tax=Actinomycetospora aurantiaca TaxID=3129233 RepID=A0ABU8MWT8_9PSEU